MKRWRELHCNVLPVLLQPVASAVQQMPIFVGHGELDPLVPVQLARQTADGLKKAGAHCCQFLHAESCNRARCSSDVTVGPRQVVTYTFTGSSCAVSALAGLCNTELHTYSGVGHHTSPEELQDLRRFLLRLLPEKLPTRCRLHFIAPHVR